MDFPVSFVIACSVEHLRESRDRHRHSCADVRLLQSAAGCWMFDKEVAEFCLFNEDFGRKYMLSCGI